MKWKALVHWKSDINKNPSNKNTFSAWGPVCRSKDSQWVVCSGSRVIVTELASCQLMIVDIVIHYCDLLSLWSFLSDKMPPTSNELYFQDIYVILSTPFDVFWRHLLFIVLGYAAQYSRGFPVLMCSIGHLACEKYCHICSKWFTSGTSWTWSGCRKWSD